ncbi:MAG TPA: phospholipase, partial [Methylibium sp.]
MQALRIYAGPAARAHIENKGLSPQNIRVVAGAAGGPKGLVLGHLDRDIFGRWLRGSGQTIHLVGASIGAWRMATGAMRDPDAAFQRLSSDYIHQEYKVEPGRETPSAEQVSREFAAELRAFFDGEVEQLIAHPRYRLHIVTSRGRHLLGREGRLRTPLGYLGATLSNAFTRKALSAWLERVVFSSPGEAMPVDLSDLRHRAVRLTAENFRPALLASCSIPFLLKAVHDIPGGPPGAYWDGGITDYHLHWNYRSMSGGGLVLYPHFQQSVVPGWLDKAFKHRHRATPFLDNVIVLAPAPEWVATLPNAKL